MKFLSSFLITASLSFFNSAAADDSPSTSAERPNVILIYTDDHGWPDVGPAGIHKDLKTPHLDALAASGVRCTDGYSSAPQCVPSRAGLMTAKYQNRIGVPANGSSMETFNKETTVADHLKKAGYTTAQIGKWHLGHGNKIDQHGFDFFYNKNANRPAPGNFTLEGKKVPTQTFPHKTYHLDDCSAHALAFIRAQKDNPFFLYLAYRAPHVPLDAPQKHLDRFPGKMPERRRQALAMIASMDDGVGAITAELEKLNLTKKTLIFYIGDNGAPLKIHKIDAPGGSPGWDGSLNEPLNGEKGMLSEGGIRVPFLVSFPGTISAGQVYTRPIIALDATATALHLAGLSIPDLDGRNILPQLKGDVKDDAHKALYWRWVGQTAVRQGDWKLLRMGTRAYLFDLATDKEEKKNLIKQKPEIAAKLAALLDTWEATLPTPEKSTLSKQGNIYFDHYLDGKLQPRPAKADRPAPPKAAPGKEAKLFQARDKNKDGQVTLAEFIAGRTGDKVPTITKLFKRRDKNSNGVWEKSEIK
ncbi:sulfatase-like hydrolase/transferase [bacterium]|nr:sulfatase-like hydrolase/transferase [bacterium]MDB4619748.1 sulfatase-like hydrolase/transferase [Akkermansiaceae bacterium]